MNTCATCQHWKPPTERDGYGDAIQIGPREGDQRPIEVRYGEAREAQRAADILFGECAAIYLREIEIGEPVPLAVTMDASQYVATLYTQAEFGCAMWEPRQ